MTNMDADGSCEVDIDEFKDWWAAMKKKGQVPSWANAIAVSANKGHARTRLRTLRCQLGCVLSAVHCEKHLRA